MTPTASTPPESDSSPTIVNDLCRDIQKAVQVKDFSRAEGLRRQLMETAPSSLKEIIETADIIEKAKSKNIDSDHMAVWHELYSELSMEEKNCLFYSMKKVVVPAGRTILNHGAYNTRLFFIDRGEVQILFPGAEKPTLLAQLGRGRLIGEYSFTSIVLCSATVMSKTEVTLYCLENAATDTWHDEHPGLYQKIQDFCLKSSNLKDMAHRKEMERRDKKRYRISGPLRGVLLSKDGTKTDKGFRGELTDISENGCAFEIQLSKRAAARALLTRHLLLTFAFEVEAEKVGCEAVGKVVKVTYFMHNEYCVHIRFSKPIDSEILRKASQSN